MSVPDYPDADDRLCVRCGIRRAVVRDRCEGCDDLVRADDPMVAACFAQFDGQIDEAF